MSLALFRCGLQNQGSLWPIHQCFPNHSPRCNCEYHVLSITPSVVQVLLPKSQSLSAFPSTPASNAPSEAILEISYESRASSDHVRLGKNCRVLGLAVNPVSETEAAFLTTDGRLFLLSQKSAPTPSLGLSALLPCLPHPPLTVRMCPPLTVKNWADFQPLVGQIYLNSCNFKSPSRCSWL